MIDADRDGGSMHILGIILGILAAAGVWYFRAQGAARGIESAVDAAGHLKGAYNRRKFRNKVEGSVLSNVQDPAEAAAVFLVVLAKEKGTMTSHVESLVSALLSDRAGLQGMALEEAMSFANWVSDEVADGHDVVRKFLPIWRSKLGTAERADLIDMANIVALDGYGAIPQQTELIRRLADGLATAR